MSTKIVIEKGQPMPNPTAHRGRPQGRPKGPVYPWNKMEVGDRIKIPMAKWANIKTVRGSVATLARQWSSNNGLDHKWATRIIGDELYVYRVN